MEKIKITPLQALMLGISSITVTGHLLFIPVIINHSGRDSWIALLLATVPSIALGFLVAALTVRYPGQTLVEYSQAIMGKWLGKCIALLFILYFFHDASLSIRGFGEFFTTAVTPRTPIMVYMVCIVLLSVYAVRNGLEVMARTNQAFLILMMIIGVVASVITHKDKDYHNFLPILEHGMKPIFTGMVTITSLFSTIFVLSMIFPFINHTDKLRRSSMITMIVLVLMFLGPLTGIVAIYGAERAMGLYFPSFQTLRDIEVGQLQRLDIVGIMLWSMGSYAKISTFLFATIVGVAQIFNLKEYKSLAVPIGLLVIIVSLINSESLIDVYRFFSDTYPYYSVFFGLVLPLMLLTTSLIRKSRGLPKTKE